MYSVADGIYPNIHLHVSQESHLQLVECLIVQNVLDQGRTFWTIRSTNIALLSPSSIHILQVFNVGGGGGEWKEIYFHS